MDNRPDGSRNYLSGHALQRVEDDEEEDVLQGKLSAPAQRVESEEDDDEVLQGKMAEPVPKNETGLPDSLKAGVESLSGYSLDDVRVHYNSSKPATVQALAYTQGTDIHVAPGQEKHLPHEAWHVAQQMAGRVSPTTNINGMPVNDNAALEHEADVMGEKALQRKPSNTPTQKGHGVDVAQRVIQREGEANGKFLYVKDIETFKDKSRIPFQFGAICFTKYDGGTVLSANFSGCFMMAFHFNSMDERLHIERLRHPQSPGFPFSSGPFVAHVALDQINAVFDAESRGLITIDAIYRPFRNGAIEEEYLPQGLGGVAAQSAFTASLHQSPAGWAGEVFRQKRVTPTGGPLAYPDYAAGRYLWEMRRLRRWSAADMDMQTRASRAFIYGRAMLDTRLSPRQRHIAEGMLLALDLRSIRLAFYTLLNPDNPLDNALMTWMVHRFGFPDHR